jgi:hypothetical protein
MELNSIPKADLNVFNLMSMINSHDMTYVFSDDSTKYRKGDQENARINKLAEEVDRKVFVELWNARVDQTIAQSFRHEFYIK